MCLAKVDRNSVLKCRLQYLGGVSFVVTPVPLEEMAAPDGKH